MDKIEFLKTLFDYVRVVDPSDNEITYTFRPEEFHVMTQNKCFDFWKQNKICENCISMRAIAENKALVKFEIENGRNQCIVEYIRE
ncbi:hypothetical protein [Fusibacter sp. 3D3]|uniref:hypothetical protein n=1 Tax=Fusibacter sp. 3D3 TaxID=1048380 RepID=UPI000853766D|nr:hypothetical protein [Fusibacter sp. 3D3]GAU77055.1 response regulator protein [Fusibacter sp. 3D3]